MTRNEREQALWHDAYMLAMSQDPSSAESSCLADAAVAEFRKRYPVEPAAPEPTAPGMTWYDEPPFTKDGTASPVWIVEYPFPILVAYFCDGWAYEVPGRSNRWHPLAGRRVCPIVKPQEPTT